MPKRMERCSDSDTIRGTPFQGICATLLHQCGPAAVAETLAEAGFIEHTFNTLKTYPLRSFLRFEYAAAKRLAAVVGGFDEAVFQLGAATVEPFFNSVAGRTLKVLSGSEPHRMFAAVPSGYQLLISAGKHEYEKKDMKSGIFYFTGDLLGPAHNSGIFDAALRQIYDIRANFELEEKELLEFKFYIRW